MKKRWSALLPLAVCAAFAVPVRADTLLCSYADDEYNISTGVEADGKPVEWPFQVIRQDLTLTCTIRAKTDDPSVVKVKSNGGAGQSATVRLGRETTRVDGEDTAEFFLVAVAPGSAVITVSIDGDPDPYATVTFAVNVTGSDTARKISFTDYPGRFLAMPEGDSRLVMFELGADVPEATTFQITCDKTDTEGHVTFDSTARVPSGNLGTFRINGINGTYSCGLTITDPNGNFDQSVLNVMVTNVPPSILASKDPENPTPWGATIFKNQSVPFPVATVGASDCDADIGSLTYRWSFAGVTTSDPNAVFTNAWSSPTPEDGFSLVYMTVSDGENTTVGYYSVVVQDSVTLYTDTVAPWAGLAKNGGIAQASSFRVSNPVGIDWSLFDGTTGKAEVGPKTAVSLNAVLEPGSYPFGWYGDTEYLRAPYATRVPNPNLKAIVSMPEEGDATVFYFASYPYYTQIDGKGAFFNLYLTDAFGDFDGDGLSDTWEDYYFQEGMECTSDRTTELPVGIPTGDYGPTGNPDGDWLPTSLYQPAPDGEGKLGWPVVATDETTGAEVTNRCRVYKYPLDFSTGGESYNKSAYDEKPLFGNFVEYRGLAEDRTGGAGEDPDAFVFYAPEIVTAAGTRGNCSGTDPENYDTDADGFSDGWEFYFWTTIKYRVNTQNWRAWDPTYSLYRTASASAGIPLLWTDEPTDFSFTIDPTQSYGIDPVAGTYRTVYEVDKDVVKNNNLIMPIAPGSVRIEFEGSAFYLVTQLGQLTTEGYDALFYQQWADTDDDGVVDTPAVDPDTGDPVLAPLDGAWVDGLSGLMHVPGWEVLSEISDTKADDIGMTTPATITYVRLNGIFTQQHLLSRFDPMNWTKTDMGSVAEVVKGLGLDEKKWDPDSDLDGDGVLDMEEYFLGTDPLHWDTDRDGMPDGWEVQRGLNPISPLNGDGTGPGDNPDEDFMAFDASGNYQHIYAYLADLSNLVYWNGNSYNGFVPGKAATAGAPYTNLREFLYSLYGMQSGIWFDAWRLPVMPPLYGIPSKYSKGIYPIDWPDTTSNPCDNDTDGDGLPDGWAAYVGINPIDTGLVTPLVVPPPDEADTDVDGLNWYEEFISVAVTNRWPETRTVYIGPNSSTTESSSTTVGGDGSTNTVYSTSGTGTEVTIRGFQWPGSLANWTNKKRSTDPWGGDTDGDGIGDGNEFSDMEDRNGDEVEFCNFDPTSVDTDLDWLPDNWEWFMGTYTPEQPAGISVTDPYGPFGDPDGDGLANFQEYLTAANYGWRHDVWYPLDNQAIWPAQMRYDADVKGPMGDWPYDPGVAPSEGPVVRPHKYTPRDFFMVPESSNWISKGLIAMKALEKRWSVSVDESPSIGLENLAAYQQRLFEIVNNPFDNGPGGPSKFMDDTRPSVDPDYNTDGVDIPGKKYFQYHSVEEHWAIVHAYEGIQGYLYSYAQCPYSWDTAALYNTPSGVPFSYIPLNDNAVDCGFPGTRPKELDSDHDNMPDYWEIYHGLNPCYGGCIGISNKAGSEADGDWDGADNWIMGADPNFVLNMRMIPAPAPSHRKEHVWYPFYPNTEIYQSFGDGESGPFGLQLERAHYDLERRPWLAGDPSADCDHDGLNNQEESYSVFANDLLHNTDPSPYWMTDITQTYESFGQKASHVNLYYAAPGGSHYGDNGFALVSLKGLPNYWWWEYPYTANDGCNAPPTYMWDFEINEGYDSDNDNIPDREEVTDASTRGKTDPQDPDSPVSRKAMYFDGYAACRTQRPFFHDQYALTSFTVEFWVRPEELPASGKIASLLQRPVMMPVDTVSGSQAWAIRHTFFVYLDDKGKVCAEVDNDGVEQPANKAVVASAGRLVPGVWTHVALVMDSKLDHLKLYLNGEQAGHVSTSLKPCTGVIMDSSYQNWQTSDGGENGLQTFSTTTVNFQYSPAPIVVGAFDTTPWSVIGLNPDAVFDENRFFKGWIDEVRIWDRCRSQTEIFNNMSKRFTKADFEGINLARFKWDMENLHSTNAEDDFPQKLLYLYNFDNLPDVVPGTEPRVGELVFATDTDPVPAGWEGISATRPVPYVPWWFVTRNKSTVYSTDYSHVPFVENVVSHLPQRPPRGVKELVPVFDGEWNLAGYRYRLSGDWNAEAESDILVGDQVVGDVSYQYEESGAEALIAPTRLANSMDPYGDTYSTGVSADYQVDPWNFGGGLDPYGVYEGVPLHSDMVPLLDAVADIDVPMWDGNGPGWDNSAIDSDGDGMPDWWEIAHGLDPNSGSGGNGAFGDADGDGLDNYAEYLAGTDPYNYDTDSDGYSDYYSRADGQSLTWGELYDDGDGMDNAWEYANGLDPEHYDADDDCDFDGWTNWEEFMAGTNPRSNVSFPVPDFNVTFHYDGAVSNSENLVVYSYGERTGGMTMGGGYDGKYTLPSVVSYGRMYFGTDGTAKIGGSWWPVTHLDFGHVATATLSYERTVDGVATLVSYELQKWNDEYGMFFSDFEGAAGLSYESGDIFCSSDLVGKAFQITVTLDGHSYPMTIDGMLRAAHTHMVGGYNRYLGFIDTNYNGEYDEGEPMGVSHPQPTLVSWDVAETEIPLTDEMFGFPRFSWPASTNTLATRYEIYVKNNSGAIAAGPIVVEAPRTFVHEWDYVAAGIKGIDFFNKTGDAYKWEVRARSVNGFSDSEIATGTFNASLVPNNGTRRAMKAVFPVASADVNGFPVEFKWEMDWRTEGVFFTIRDSGGHAVAGLDNLYVPFPVRHGKTTSDSYYYTAVPQLENGRSVVVLPPGTYTYQIKENIRSTASAVSPKTVTGTFRVVSSDDPRYELYNRYLHSASGSIQYFGKVRGGLASDAVAYSGNGVAVATLDGVQTSVEAVYNGEVVRGSMFVELVSPSGETVDRLNDRATNVEEEGLLHAESGIDVWSGSIGYPVEENDPCTIRLVFDSRNPPPPAGTVVKVGVKRFNSPIVVQAFKLPDNATTSVSISGQPVAQLKLETKGAFKFESLTQGNYAFRAFVDSNGNGMPDDWETQGVAVRSGSVSPVLSREAPVISVETDVSGLLVVLHDRDTDNDLLPDSWEWEMWGSVSAHSGYDASGADGVLRIWQEYADGPLDSDPRTPDTDLDGLTDAMELLVTGTDTHLSDTDADGVGDLEEFLSGSDPLDPEVAVPWTVPGLAFGEDGAPYVDCAYPALPRGVVLTYVLQRKASLSDAVWEDVDELVVAATNAVLATLGDGVAAWCSPAGSARMAPADKLETADWTSGFFRVRVFADYGKMVDNGDGTFSFWTWTEGGASFVEVARGEGTLVRDAEGNWSFVDRVSCTPGSLVRRPDGTWSFVR